MKIVHTADWHIGKIVNEYSMIGEQEYMLGQFVEIVKEEEPHVVIIAGDIYDRSIAPIEAVELLDKTLGRIILDFGIPVLLISGNHDSPERLSFGSGILRSKNLFIEGNFKKDITKIVINDDYNKVNFYMLPYVDPAIVRNIYEDGSIRTHNQAMRAIIDRLNGNFDKSERNIMITHGYARGISELSFSDSERPLSIGGTDYVEIENFQGFNYTALGHLHRPQYAGGKKVYYSGSLLKYSFSEVDHKKSVTVVNMDEKGDVIIEQKELKPKRDMRDLEGKLSELLDPSTYRNIEQEHFYRVILTDKGELLDPMSKLKSVYPNVLQIMVKERIKGARDIKTAAGEGYKDKTKLQLFKEFYKSITEDDLETENIEVMSRIIEGVEKKGDDLYEAY